MNYLDILCIKWLRLRGYVHIVPIQTGRQIDDVTIENRSSDTNIEIAIVEIPTKMSI